MDVQNTNRFIHFIKIMFMKIMSIKDPTCKGCSSANEYGYCKMRLPTQHNGFICPCAECLLKCHCSQICEYFRVYSEYVVYNP
jgi:hypothetical protein